MLSVGAVVCCTVFPHIDFTARSFASVVPKIKKIVKTYAYKTSLVELSGRGRMARCAEDIVSQKRDKHCVLFS